MYRNIGLFISALFLIISSSAQGYDNNFTPWDYAKPLQDREISTRARELSLPAYALRAGIEFFSKFISPVDGDRCFMYPTCAGYGREAVEKHGFFVGTLMTVDRLIHEGNEKEWTPLIKTGNRLRYFDPVSNNDFWWLNK